VGGREAPPEAAESHSSPHEGERAGEGARRADTGGEGERWGAGVGVAVGCNTPPLRATPEGRGGRSRTWRRCDEGDPSTEGEGVGEGARAEGAQSITGDPTGSQYRPLRKPHDPPK
jgi:hypothetical protein